MPYSDQTFDPKVKDFLAQNHAKKYLDIGPGAGKYGKMIRDVNSNAYIVAIEAEKSYISKFNLRDLYDEVHHTKIEDFINSQPSFTVDITIVGDCLEHLKKSDGVDLIHYLVYRTKFVVLVFPSKYIQYDWNGHINESHNSVWGKEDFRLFNFDYQKQGFMNLVIIKGYVGDPEAECPKS